MADLTFSTVNERPIRTGAVSDALVDAIKATLNAPEGTQPSVEVDVTGKDSKGVKRVMANLSALGRTGRIDGRVRTTHVPEKGKVYAWAEKATPKKKAAKKKAGAAPVAPPETVNVPAEPVAAEPVAAE